MKKIFIIILLLVIIFIVKLISAPLPTPNYTLVGDSVYINDSNVYINITPHTSNNPIIEFKSKSFTGNIDVVFGFNTSSVAPTKAETNPQLQNVMRSYTCTGTYFNFTTSPNHFWCWLNSTAGNGTRFWTLLFEHDFNTGNLATKTASWTEQETIWTDISGVFNQVNYNFQGFNKWFYKTNVPITANQTYKLRLTLQSKEITGSQKYFFGVKQSSQPLAQSISAGTF